MLQLEHMKRIVDACYPASQEDALRYWHDITPVKFGNSILWAEDTDAIFAQYQIPESSPYMLILRVECYTTTFDAAAPGFGQFLAPPPITAAWRYLDFSTTTAYRLTPVVPVHVLCDSDEFLFAESDHLVGLAANVPAPPDGNPRYIRTLVYAYLVGPLIADRLGSNESVYSGTTAET